MAKKQLAQGHRVCRRLAVTEVDGEEGGGGGAGQQWIDMSGDRAGLTKHTVVGLSARIQTA